MPTPDFAALLCCPCPQDCGDLFDVLEEMGIQPLHAVNPADARDLAGLNRFVLIVLDLDSDPQWKVTVRALQQRAPRASLVVCSRLADEHLWIDALEAGAFDLACKPFCRRELLWILENAVKRQDRARPCRPVTPAARQALTAPAAGVA